MQHRLLHAGDQEFPIRADCDAKMRALPFETLGLRTGSVRKPEGRAIVVRNRQTKAFRCKTQAGHRRRQLKAPLVAIPREHMRSFACRDHATAPSEPSAT